MKIVIPYKHSHFRATIKKGSGIVMLPFNKARRMALIYYEGNLYGADNLKTFNERIQCAAGRAYTKYPTVAFSGVLREDLDQFRTIGKCDPDDSYSVLFEPGVNNVIKEWIGAG